MAGFPFFLAGRHLLMMKSSRQRDQSRSAPLLHTPGTPAIQDDRLFRGMEEGRRPPPTQPTAAEKRFGAIFVRGIAATYSLAMVVSLLMMRFVYQDKELQDTSTMMICLIVSLVPGVFLFAVTHEEL
uniref:Uncharacterized protein n=1 Tax=Hordeum vulgare subsp. vulgare TaxID=112509 RepID=A0A8I6YV02_HORVV